MRNVLRDLFLARIPVALLLILAVFGPIATGPAAKMLSGLFEVDRWFGLMLVSCSALVISFASLVIINLIVEHGPQRFRDGVPLLMPLHRYNPSRLLFWMGVLPALIVSGYALVYSGIILSNITAVITGMMAALVLLLGAQIVQFLLTDPATTPRPNYLIYPFDSVPALDAMFMHAYQTSPLELNPVRRVLRILAGFLIRRLPGITQGYVYRDQSGLASLYPGCVFAFVLAFGSFALWIGIGMGKQHHLGQSAGASVSPLSYVLLAILTGGWILGALTFFFDRYHIPLLLILFLWAWFAGNIKSTDHFYRVSPQSKPVSYAKPSEILKKRRHPLIIATAGGGIQAAAWTAQVIQGITEACPDCNFLDNVALFSSVSGGSLGSLYVGAYMAQSKNINSLRRVTEISEESSLDEVAWGLVNPDLWRVFLPVLGDPAIDRGWALERSWEYRANLEDTWLSDWALRAHDHFPAFAFNASVIEQGAPVVFSTSDFPSAENEVAQIRNLKRFDKVCDSAVDIRVSTAARLSATFPFVAPAPRALYCMGRPDFHIVDGGYYDNYGILAAVDWLDQALRVENAQVTVHSVAIVEIRPSPQPTDSKGRLAGWRYQLLAPLKGLLEIRDNEQLHEDHAKLDLYLRTSPTKIIDIGFEYPKDPPKGCDHQPLSWKLTHVQQKCIKRTWDEGLSHADTTLSIALEDLKAYLRAP